MKAERNEKCNVCGDLGVTCTTIDAGYACFCICADCIQEAQDCIDELPEERQVAR